MQRGTVYDSNRARALMTSHNYALDLARPDNPDWIIQPDADERIDELPEGWETSTGVVMKLFDFYITEEDVDLRYDERKWLGPEYRNILMMYRYTPSLRFEFHDQRIMRLRGPQQVLRAGYVRHYGKAISVEEWEKTCDYYANEWPEPYASKWKNRRGQAVHSISDWGRPLIQWDERDLYGIRL